VKSPPFVPQPPSMAEPTFSPHHDEHPANDLTIFFNQDQFSIIKRYRKLHRFLFKHGIYVLMVVLGLLGVYNCVNKNNKLINLCKLIEEKFYCRRQKNGIKTNLSSFSFVYKKQYVKEHFFINKN
jgi:hypothetical protein